MLQRLFCVLLLLAIVPLATATPLPAEFRHARVFLQPQTTSGEAVTFYTDTGGGANMLTRDAAERFGLLPGETTGSGDEAMTLVEFPAFVAAASIPLPNPRFFKGKLMLVDGNPFAADGFLGGRWFADRIWQFDYLAGKLHLLERAPTASAHTVMLGFQVDGNGARTLHFPRMPVEIDGERIDMLLDTGATATLTAAAAGHFKVPAGTQVGASFITKSTFEKWANRHPDWLVVDGGDSVQGHAFAMIRVPEVTVAGHVVGPVWFAQRPDRAFREYMTSMMDAPIEGALGGSAFRYLRMVIDYPAAQAHFTRP